MWINITKRAHELSAKIYLPFVEKKTVIEEDAMEEELIDE
jgi:hypothetical protein